MKNKPGETCSVSVMRKPIERGEKESATVLFAGRIEEALRERGYAIVPEGGGQKIVRIRPRKKGAGSPEISGGKWGAKAPKTDPEGME